MQGNEAITAHIIDFADSAIQNASGGLVAGIGVLFLIWTAIQLLAGIENSFNGIWGIKKGRSWRRKISDYLALLVVYPFLLIIMMSSTAFLVSRLEGLSGTMPDPGTWHIIVTVIVHILHLLAAWLVFFFIYIFSPNTNVRFTPAATAGIVVAIVWLILQSLYVYAQTKLTSYNAIYGSFAALPFFLVWLNFSWTIVIFGAQLSFAIQNVNQYEMEPIGSKTVSARCRKLCALRIMKLAMRRFLNHQPACSAEDFSRELEIPILSARSVIDDLCETGFLVPLMRDSSGDDRYQAALPPDEVTPLQIFRDMDSLGVSFPNPAGGAQESEKQMDLLWDNADQSLNKPVGRS